MPSLPIVNAGTLLSSSTSDHPHPCNWREDMSRLPEIRWSMSIMPQQQLKKPWSTFSLKIRQFRNVTSVITVDITEVLLGPNISLITPITEYF